MPSGACFGGDDLIGCLQKRWRSRPSDGAAAGQGAGAGPRGARDRSGARSGTGCRGGQGDCGPPFSSGAAGVQVAQAADEHARDEQARVLRALLRIVRSGQQAFVEVFVIEEAIGERGRPPEGFGPSCRPSVATGLLLGRQPEIEPVAEHADDASRVLGLPAREQSSWASSNGCTSTPMSTPGAVGSQLQLARGFERVEPRTPV